MSGPFLATYALGCAAVAQEPQDEGIRARLSRQGEEALGKIGEGLAAKPLVTGAISRAFEARERAVQAQEAAMGALGIPSAADIERLTRRLRSVSQRLEGIEDSVDRLDERLGSIEGGVSALDGRLESLGRQLDALSGQLDKLGKASTGKGGGAAAKKPSQGEQKAEAEKREALEGRLEQIGGDLGGGGGGGGRGGGPP